MLTEISKLITDALDSWATETMVEISVDHEPTWVRVRRVGMRCFGGRWTLIMLEDKQQNLWPTRKWTFAHPSFEVNQDGLASGNPFTALRHLMLEGFTGPDTVAFTCGGMPVRIWLTSPSPLSA